MKKSTTKEFLIAYPDIRNDVIKQYKCFRTNSILEFIGYIPIIVRNCVFKGYSTVKKPSKMCFVMATESSSGRYYPKYFNTSVLPYTKEESMKIASSQLKAFFTRAYKLQVTNINITETSLSIEFKDGSIATIVINEYSNKHNRIELMGIENMSEAVKDLFEIKLE